MNTKININRILTVYFLIAILFGVSSCSKELDQFPQSQFANATFWTTETNALIGLTGVYRGNMLYELHNLPDDWWSWSGLVIMEHATDNAFDRRGINAPQNKLTDGTLLPNNEILLQLWSASYAKITLCNNLLENIDKVSMAESKIKRMSAEARFIRACQYFYLSQFWGSVPLVKKTLTPDEANNVSKAPKSEIISFIITEFTEASTDLPRYKDIPASEFGRASKQAALSFLGRVFLAEKRYSEASAIYKQIIDFGDNIIDPDFKSIFTETNEKSAENIFSNVYSPGLCTNTLLQYIWPRVNGGYCLSNPYENLAVQYDFDDGTPFSYTDPRYDYRNEAAHRDPRFAATVLCNGATFQGKVFNSDPDSKSADAVAVGGATKTGYTPAKYLNEKFTGDLTTGYGGDMPVIRYAEVLLSYLESELEGGKPITQSLLDMTINKVRRRASVNMPPIAVTNPNQLRPILRKERRIEFAMEGIRYWDLLRWGIIGDVMQGDFWGESYPTAKRKSGKVDPTGLKRWFVQTKSFRKGQDEVWPIPQSEQNINPNLR